MGSNADLEILGKEWRTRRDGLKKKIQQMEDALCEARKQVTFLDGIIAGIEESLKVLNKPEVAQDEAKQG